MKKLLLVFLLSLYCGHYPAFADIVGEISIEGNNSVPAKDIKEVISMSVGQEYDPVKTAEDISAIYDLNKFNDVSIFLEDISTGTIKVIYKLEERPIVKRIEVRGNTQVKTKKILKKAELKSGKFYDEFQLQSDEKTIQDYYKEEGFAECTVESYTTDIEDENSVILTFYVKEGNKVKIDKVKLEGVVKEKYKKVLKLLKSKKGKDFRQTQLDEDLETIEKYYKNKGYLNAVVSDPVFSYDETRTLIYITIAIEEGNKYYIDTINFSGNTKFSSARLREDIDLKKGDLYSEDNIRMAMFSIQEVYGKDGHIKMSVVPRFHYNDEQKTVEIEYAIYEGPKVYIRNIYIDGNYITRDYVIEREFKVSEGGPFNVDKVRKSQSELYKLGFFSDVRVEMLPTGAVDQTDLVFIVEEQKTGMASVGAGYSSVDKLVGSLKVSWGNLFGRGQKLSLMWEFGTGDTKKQNYRLDFTEPYLFNTRTPFSFSIYNTITTRYVDNDSYKERRRGGSITLGRHFTDEITAYCKYALEDIKIYEIDADLEDDLSESEDMTSSVTPSLIYDSRDYPFDPSKGLLLRVSNQIAGGVFGGDRDFNKFEMKTAYFKTIWWRFVGVLNIVNGAVTPYGDTAEVPIYERFSVGGAESLRGYDYWEIGPEEGGNYKFICNAELKFPIVSEKKQTILQGAFFYDIGNAWKYYNDITFDAGLDSIKLKRGYGFGIRFKTPAFPIRLDWGYGIDKSPKESQWYFTLGDIF